MRGLIPAGGGAGRMAAPRRNRTDRYERSWRGAGWAGRRLRPGSKRVGVGRLAGQAAVNAGGAAMGAPQGAKAATLEAAGSSPAAARLRWSCRGAGDGQAGSLAWLAGQGRVIRVVRAAHRPRDAAGDAPRPARHRPKTPVVPAGRAPRFFADQPRGASPRRRRPLHCPGTGRASGPHGVSARPRAGGRQGGRQRSGCVGWRRWRGPAAGESAKPGAPASRPTGSPAPAAPAGEKPLVPWRRLELPRLAAHGPEPCASTNSATRASRWAPLTRARLSPLSMADRGRRTRPPPAAGVRPRGPSTGRRVWR